MRSPTYEQIRQAAKTLDAKNVPPANPSLFVPEIWSDHIIDAFKSSMRLMRKTLTTRDVWAPTGETYEEALAWAKLCGVVVYTDMDKSFLYLHKPGCVTRDLPLCSPTELIDAIRDYAPNAKAPQVDDE